MTNTKLLQELSDHINTGRAQRKLDRISEQLVQLHALDPTALDAVEKMVRVAIDIRIEEKSTRTLDARLRRAHPKCGGEFIQEPPRSGQRSWRCTKCRKIVTLPEGGGQ
jgi:hypothetical protein